jgi:hypothetical protein
LTRVVINIKNREDKKLEHPEWQFGVLQGLVVDGQHDVCDGQPHIKPGNDEVNHRVLLLLGGRGMLIFFFFGVNISASG